MTKQKLFEAILNEAKREPFDHALPKTADASTEKILEDIVKRAMKNPAHKHIQDDIHTIGQLQSTAGLTGNQKKVLAQMYDELMGDCDAATLQWIMNKWM